MSYTASLFHIVYCTNNRQITLSPLHKDALHKYIIGIANQERHHATTDFGGEIRWLVEAIGEDFYENSFS